MSEARQAIEPTIKAIFQTIWTGLGDALAAMLEANGPAPQAPFDELKVLLPAREFKNRHASILLCLNATLDALDAAGA